MKILWLTNIPSPYRVDFFNELGKLCELTVLFEKKNASDRDDSWLNFEIKNFHAIFLKGISCGVAEAFCPNVVRYLHKKMSDKIIVTNYSDPTGILAVTTMRLRNIPYIIEGDGGFAGNGKGIREIVKKWILKNSALCFSTSQTHDDYYKKYGVTQERIVRYPFTSLHKSDILDSPVSQEKKNLLRKKLGITEEKMIISVGQFIPRKGFDILIETMAKLDRSIGCYIIGGVPTHEYTQMVSDRNLCNVHFMGFMNKHDLFEYYMAADLFILPTREDVWGLVVNEAMANGLPVITTNGCIAGLTLIKSHGVGKIVPVEDVDSLASAINEKLTTLSKDSNEAVLQTIHNYTIEEMAKVHIEVFEKY